MDGAGGIEWLVWQVVSTLAVAVNDDVVGDREQPGAERLPAVAADRRQRLDEDQAGRVLSRLTVAQSPVAVLVDAGDIAIVERGEGGRVVPREPGELPIRTRLLVAIGLWVSHARSRHSRHFIVRNVVR
jgi:hypothetical protein